MAPSSTSTPTSGGKSMSSRLLTMKFMQRAAASSPTSPSTPGEPSSKRRKVADDSPSRFNVEALADQRAIQAAVADEEAKRQAALERQAAEAGDTRWVLNFGDGRDSRAPTTPALRIVQTGFANLDNALPLHLRVAATEEVSEDKPIAVGRKSFGKFNRVLEKQQNPSLEDSSDSDSDSDEEGKGESESESEDSDDDPSGTKALIKASQKEVALRAKNERKAKRKAEKAESLELAKKRKKKEAGKTRLTLELAIVVELRGI
ncbi:hypothetical protein BP5796_10121 [Coleophoma crateriformis]|uniref:Uncharacterized protein n=1 Tax=Coleophoma crateriformis TaxID=565419 RepID=A0A3D8QUE9_9HELO|nr:hypothetical protein BP5796_10121 [Coleophoma crateriformis]